MISYNNKINHRTEINLKKFYNSSQTYLECLEKHNENTFSKFINVCKKNIPEHSHILDCGCGIGLSSYLLNKSGFKVTGIDLSSLFISKAKNKFSNQLNLNFSVESVSKMSFSDNFFDAVCCYDLLEHVADVENSLEEMCRILKKGGILIIFIPNHLRPIEHLFSFFRWDKEKICKPWMANSRIKTFYEFIKTTYLTIGKTIGINKKIYYLQPILSNDKNKCGGDFDATWLTNRFDIENCIKNNNICVLNMTDDIYYKSLGRKVAKRLKLLRFSKKIQNFFLKISTKKNVIIGVKN